MAQSRSPPRSLHVQSLIRQSSRPCVRLPRVHLERERESPGLPTTTKLPLPALRAEEVQAAYAHVLLDRTEIDYEGVLKAERERMVVPRVVSRAL
jgi:hypothetical protein